MSESCNTDVLFSGQTIYFSGASTMQLIFFSQHYVPSQGQFPIIRFIENFSQPELDDMMDHRMA